MKTIQDENAELIQIAHKFFSKNFAIRQYIQSLIHPSAILISGQTIAIALLLGAEKLY